jgi:hypothetical protein
MCAFKEICKDNASINCIAIQHEESTFLLPLRGHTLVKNSIQYRRRIATIYDYNKTFTSSGGVFIIWANIGISVLELTKLYVLMWWFNHLKPNGNNIYQPL